MVCSCPKARPIHALLALVCAGTLLSACAQSHDSPRVVVYAALDRDFSQPVLTQFQQESGVEVLPVFDSESTKSFGLTSRIQAEARAPACDLFWNNEVLNTIRLKHLGLLQPFLPPNAADYPESFRDRDNQWYGFAARARILIVNRDLVAEPDTPTSVRDLTDPRWRSRAGLAKPLFGTTATHAACLFAALGEDAAKDFFRAIQANDVRILSGNRQVAAQVAAGQIAFGLTDTDDALAEIDAGSPVAIVYPDQQTEGLGTLFIPNTLAIIKGAPHLEAARTLANHLLSPGVETALAEGPSGQIPLNRRVTIQTRVETPLTRRPMHADFEQAARLWEPVVAPFLTELFAAPTGGN